MSTNTEPRSAPHEVERWASVIEVANHLGVKQDTIYKWLRRKAMPAHKVGRLWKFRIVEVDHWVESGKAARE
jgi:excisionase family DNA binding protein